MNPKLLQINSVVNWGSTGKIAEGIAQSAIMNGWDSYIAYGRSKGYEAESCSELIRIGCDYELIIHGLITRIADRHGLGSVIATQRLIEQIDRIVPDIIHLHNIHGYYINIEILFNYLAVSNIPVVWTLHDCWPITGHCSYFEFVKCNKWQTQCHHCPQKENYPASIFIDRSSKNYELKKRLFTSPQNMVVVPVSNWLENIVEKSYLSKYLIEMIHNGVDIDIFTDVSSEHNNIRSIYSVPKNKFMVLGVANVWDDRKGLNDFLELSREINSEIVIVLVGLTVSQIRELPSNIIGIARTQSAQELAALYRTADLFVNPTWEDNFPTTNLEALACGCPVLTYNTGGSIEAITPQTGFVVSQGDLHAVSLSIELIRQKGRNFFSIPCRERAVKYYNKYKQFGEYIKLYNQCLKIKPF